MHTSSHRSRLASFAFAMLAGSVSATEIALDVRGLVCAFCAKGIEATANRHPAIASATVDLDNALVRFVLKPKAALNADGAKKILTEAGFDVVSATLTTQSTPANLARLAQLAARPLPSTATSAYVVERAGVDGRSRLHARLTVDRKSAPQWLALTSAASGATFAALPAEIPLGWAPGSVAPRVADSLFGGRPALLVLVQTDDQTTVLYLQVQL